MQVSVKRFGPEISFGLVAIMKEREDGDFVKYSDFQEVSRLLSAFLDQIDDDAMAVQLFDLRLVQQAKNDVQ